MEERFIKVEQEFILLRKDYQQEKITEREFKDRLKELRLTDKNGRCWTIGAKTGRWYFYDGKDWVESNPPTLQQGRAICIYCGFENDIRSEACDYCGGNMGSGGFTCPDCGCDLISPSQECPDCAARERSPKALEQAGASDIPDLTEEPGTTGDTFDTSDLGKDAIFHQFEDTGPIPQESEPDFPDDGGPNRVLRSVNLVSLMLFMGVFGTLLGIVLGVFVGISSFFMGIVRSLPPGFQSMHGTLFGGVVYGLLGGVFGFIGLGAYGFLSALLTNLVLSFFGGIKIRIDRIS